MLSKIRMVTIIAFTILFANCSKSEIKNSVNIKINGMHCAGCVVQTQKALKNTPGVKTVRINGITGLATIKLDSSGTKMTDLVEAVQKIGFDAVPVEPKEN